MSSLLAALANGGSALRQFERAVSLTQSDVINASTAGYAAQQLRFEATPFAPEAGLYGGVQVGAIESTRDDFAEAAVRRQTSNAGFYSQNAENLASVEAAFDVGANGGLADGIQELYDAFSAWSQSPNDANARQEVLLAAENVAVAFRQSADTIRNAAAACLEQAQTLAAKVNDIGRQLAEINKATRQSGSSASVDAEMYAKLEDLSEITSFTVLRASDNTITVLLGGQVPLVIGDHTYEIEASPRSVASAGSPSAIRLTDAGGQDVTNLLNTGKLGGLIETVNNTVAGLLGGDSGQGALNRLATALATRINNLLAGGTTEDGTAGVALFDVSSDGAAAANLRVADIDGEQLAAIDPGPPSVANGIASKLAALSTPSSAADMLDGVSFLDNYGRITAQVGSALSDAKTSQARYSQLASQARSLRSEISGVSLDEEAVRLVEFQRAYNAAARSVTVINEMLDTLMQLGK